MRRHSRDIVKMVTDLKRLCYSVTLKACLKYVVTRYQQKGLALI